MTPASPICEETREFDIVLWGATGFVGRLMVEYLAERYARTDLRWAMAGRSRERLEALRSELAENHPALLDVPILIADSQDKESLRAMASKTRVVATTVGPYAKYGTLLVEVCIDEGTHCCDLTGEVQWMRRTVEAFHDKAVEKGVRIVHTCGFDSIPSDLGTLLVQDFAKERFGAPCESIKFVLWRAKGGFSGGTVASMTGLIEEAARDAEVRRLLSEPYALNPPGERSGPDQPPRKTPHFDKELEIWAGPFVMAAVNEPVVRRSNALLGFAYGRDFRYSEVMRTGKGPSGAAGAVSLTTGLGAFAVSMSLKPTRKLLERFVLPAPGEGPTREAIENGFFHARLFGQGKADDGTEFTVEGDVRGQRDPGYGATAIMLVEAALCLAKDDLSGSLPGGILTPATAMGQPLIARLRAAGMTFDAVDR